MAVMSTARCVILENPDISGIGVRIAIYIQNLLCFVPALWALWDGEVKQEELDSAETQTTTNLVLAFAILVSSIVQASTLGLTSYHASIVLSMSWMNNTNAFIYFLLYIHHKRGEVDPTWPAWRAHLREKFSFMVPVRRQLKVGPEPTDPSREDAVRGSSESPVTNGRQSAKILIKRFVILLGTLHLTLMAAFGIWMWTDPVTFGTDAAREANKCAVASATIAIVGGPVPMGAKALRIASLVLYAFFVMPGLNLILPMAFFLFLYFRCHYLPPAGAHEAIVKGVRSARPALVGLVVLLIINVIFLFDIEVTLRRNKLLQNDREETQWGFGQILAILLLCLPLRDVLETLLDRKIKRQQLKFASEQLSNAMRTQNIDDIHQAVKLGADLRKALDAEGSRGLIPWMLELAVERYYPDIVQILVERPTTDINATNLSGCTLLIIACDRSGTFTGELETIEALLHRQDIDVNAFDPRDGRTALLKACARENQQAVEELTSNLLVDVNREDNDQDTPLMIASMTGNVPIASSLLKRSDANKRGKNGRTALMCAAAARRGQPPFIQTLLDREVINVNLQDDNGDTALIHASEAGHATTVAALLRRPDVDANITNKYAVTALMKAISRSHRAIVQQILADPNTNANMQDDNMATALIHASDIGDAVIVENLLQQPNIDINKATTRGLTALMFASLKGHTLVAHQLLNHGGADINARDDQDHTPLMAAAWNGHASLIELLLQQPGVDTNLRNAGGKTALDLAQLRDGYDEIAGRLAVHEGGS